MTKYLAILLLLLSTTCFTACSSTEAAEPQPVNTQCVMNPENEVDTMVTTEFEGKTIGFCCNNCKSKFESLTRGQKVAKLQSAGVSVN